MSSQHGTDREIALTTETKGGIIIDGPVPEDPVPEGQGPIPEGPGLVLDPESTGDERGQDPEKDHLKIAMSQDCQIQEVHLQGLTKVLLRERETQ